MDKKKNQSKAAKVNCAKCPLQTFVADICCPGKPQGS